MTQNSIADNRMVWLDVVRCVAMLMVIGVHCIECVRNGCMINSSLARG